jgi:hypothetical protein
LPGGIYLLGLRYFLEHQGFTPSDLADMPAYARNFGRLIAFRVITEDQALEAIGYLNRNQLQAVLLRGAGCTSVREQAMQKVARECADELEKQKQYFAQHGKFPKPELKSLAELYGVNISFDWLGEPSGKTMMPGSHGLLSEYAKSHKEKLAEALEQFRSNTAIPPLKPPEPEVVKPLPPPAVEVEVSALLQAPVAPPLEPISATQSLDPNDLVAIAAHQMGALIPLLEALAMNPEFSKEHRVRLRELVNAYGSGGVFHLYQLVEALTSESSRKKLT